MLPRHTGHEQRSAKLLKAVCDRWRVPVDIRELADVVARDRRGFVLTGTDLVASGQRPAGWTLPRDPYHLETSVPGVFAAGDVRAESVKRVASAVGEGAMAVLLVHRYLEAQ